MRAIWKMECVIFDLLGKIVPQNRGYEQEISFHCAVHAI